MHGWLQVCAASICMAPICPPSHQHVAKGRSHVDERCPSKRSCVRLLLLGMWGLLHGLPCRERRLN
jgi:hypothetical protein